MKRTIIVVVALGLFGLGGYYAYKASQPKLVEEVETVTQNKATKTITADDLRVWMNKRTGEFAIVDVRSTEDFKKGHVPGAVNVTMEELITPKAVAKLPISAQVPIVVYGDKEAGELMLAMGYLDVYELVDYQNWTDIPTR